MRARSAVVMGLGTLILGALACSEGREPVNTSADGGEVSEDGGVGVQRGLTPVVTNNAYQYFRALRAPDETVFVAGSDTGRAPMVRILPDRSIQDDGALHASGATLIDPGHFGVSSDGTVRWFWGEMVDASVSRIQVRRFDPDTATWAATETVAEGSNVSVDFGANVSAGGEEVVVWDQGADVWATRNSGSGWSTPEQLDPPDDPNGKSHDASGAIFAGAPNGQGLAVWDESGRLRASIYAPGSGWSSTPVPDVPFRKADARWAALGESGHAAILWIEDGTDLHGVVYDGTGWSGDQVVDSASEIGPVSVAILAGGQAVALASTKRSDGVTALDLYAFDGATWKKHVLTEPLGVLVYTLIATRRGDAVAIFPETDLGAALPRYVLRSVTFDPASGPSSLRTIAPPWLDFPNRIQAFAGAAGEVWALWSETSITELQTRLYLEPVP